MRARDWLEVYRCANPNDPSPSFDYAGSGLPNRYVTSFAIAPDEQTVYVTFSGTGTAHIWKSTDQGNTWAPLTSGLPDEPFNSIVIHPADPSVLYAGSDFGVYSSFDAGATWAAYGAGLPRVAVDSLAISSSQGLLQAGTHGRGIWQVQAQTTGVLQAQASAVPASGAAPLNVSFTANVAGGKAPYTFAWSFGDGSAGTGQTTSHTYTAVGDYPVTVTVTDSASGTATGTTKVSVIVPPPSVTGVRHAEQPPPPEGDGDQFQGGLHREDRRDRRSHDPVQERHPGHRQGVGPQGHDPQGKAGHGLGGQPGWRGVRRFPLHAVAGWWGRVGDEVPT